MLWGPLMPYDKDSSIATSSPLRSARTRINDVLLTLLGIQKPLKSSVEISEEVSRYCD
jgi:hypothetical protein